MDQKEWDEKTERAFDFYEGKLGPMLPEAIECYRGALKQAGLGPQSQPTTPPGAERSSCCSGPLTVESDSVEGTSFYICLTCGKPCDVREDAPTTAPVVDAFSEAKLEKLADALGSRGYGHGWEKSLEQNIMAKNRFYKALQDSLLESGFVSQEEIDQVLAPGNPHP